MRFQQLTRSHSNDGPAQRKIEEGDQIYWRIACFKFGTRSLEMIRISFLVYGTAGWDTYFWEPDAMLFSSGRFLQKEVVNQDYYLGDKAIWYFGADRYIW
jgi:hypothetical protein